MWLSQKKRINGVHFGVEQVTSGPGSGGLDWTKEELPSLCVQRGWDSATERSTFRCLGKGTLDASQLEDIISRWNPLPAGKVSSMIW